MTAGYFSKTWSLPRRDVIVMYFHGHNLYSWRYYAIQQYTDAPLIATRGRTVVVVVDRYSTITRLQRLPVDSIS
jgi:hypothetical protein